MHRLILAIAAATLSVGATAEEPGTVFGTVILNGKPVVDADVHLNRQLVDVEDLKEGEKTRTDANGKYRFENVPTGPYSVGILEMFTNNWGEGGTYFGTTNHMRNFYVSPGESQEVNIGGSGRSLTGRMILPIGESRAVAFTGGDQRRIYIPITHPDVPDDATDEEKESIREVYYQSDAFITSYEASGSLMLDVKEDGTFSAHDVPPGHYVGSIDVTATQGGRAPIGRVNFDFTVPEGDYNSVYNLGDIELELFTQLEPGAAAPVFTVPTLDGNTVSFADFTGKVVLLDFWATWCGPCVASTPELKALWEQYKDRDDFAVIGLSLDQTVDKPKAYANEHDLPWAQGFLGDWSKAELPDQYAVRGIPTFILIDRDGTVLARGHSVENVSSALRLAMENAALTK